MLFNIMTSSLLASAVNSDNSSNIQSVTGKFPENWEQYWNIFISWAAANWSIMLITLIAAIIIYLSLNWVQKRASRFAKKSEYILDFRSIVGRTIGKMTVFFRIMVAVELVNHFSNPPAQIHSALNFLFLVAIVIQIAIWVRQILFGLVERRSAREDEDSEMINNAMTIIQLFITFAVFAIATIVILDNLGVNITGLLAGFGIGGIAIGLAAQGIFADLFATISIIFDRPFQRGDTIEYDNTIATVDKIGMRSTRLTSVMGERKIVSNVNLLNTEITNYARLNRRRTRHIIGVTYQTPPDVALEIPKMLEKLVVDAGHKFLRCGFTEFADSSLNFQLDYDILSDDYEVVFNERHKIGLQILELFNAKGIDFAYPTNTQFSAGPDGKLVMPGAQ